jgi:hypothetical protein
MIAMFFLMQLSPHEEPARTYMVILGLGFGLMMPTM